MIQHNTSVIGGHAKIIAHKRTLGSMFSIEAKRRLSQLIMRAIHEIGPSMAGAIRVGLGFHVLR